MEKSPLDFLRNKVLGYPPIVNEILHHMTSYEDLRSCELVCTTWKHEAAKLLRDHDILYRIFQNLKPQDIGTCRLVSKKWRLTANHLLKSDESKVRVWIPGEEAVTRFINTFDTNPCVYSRFVFGNHFDLTLDLGTANTQVLTNTIGVHIKNLSLIGCKCKYEILRTLLFEKLPNLSHLSIWSESMVNPEIESPTELNQPPTPYDWKTPKHTRLPNLKTLFIFMSLVDIDNHKKLLPSAKEFVTDILQAAPNLEELRGIPAKTRRIICDVILREPQIVLPRMSHLEVVEVAKPLTAELFSQLEAKQFPLKSFHTCIGGEEYPYESMYSFLSSLKDSLETLSIYVQYGVKVSREFPKSLCVKLRKLKTFKLQCERAEIGYNFLQDLEHLEVLTLIKTDMSKFIFKDSFIYPQTRLFANLRRLNLEEVSGELDQRPFRNLRVTISST